MKKRIFTHDLRAPGLLLLLIGSLLMAATQSMWAQTYTRIFSFGNATGIYPISGVTVDHAGNLYGTTNIGDREQTVMKAVARSLS